MTIRRDKKHYFGRQKEKIGLELDYVSVSFIHLKFFMKIFQYHISAYERTQKRN